MFSRYVGGCFNVKEWIDMTHVLIMISRGGRDYVYVILHVILRGRDLARQPTAMVFINIYKLKVSTRLRVGED